jgi:hypothetical protein
MFDPPGDSISLRDAEEMESPEGMMEIRMPIASSGEVRNEGDDPLSDTALRGMAQQIDSLTRGVFPEHGGSTAVDAGRYSQFEKLGYWADADLQREASDDGEDLLMATARMPDPESLPAATGDYREALAILKEQAKRGIPISSSIGWREDESAPGGVDLLEASIVGIGADSRTTTEGGTEALARAAVEAGADPDDLVAEVRRIVRGDDAQTDTQHMSDDDPSGDDPDETTDGEQTDRAPDDVTPSDLAALVAGSYDGVDASDLVDAWDDMGDFTGSVDTSALVSLVATTTDADPETVESAMADLMDGDDGEEQADGYEDKEDEEDDDEERADDSDPDAEEESDERDLAAEVDELREELRQFRESRGDVETPDTERDADPETDDADADATESSDTEQTERAASGPDWRA